jgi:hypothetical protein
MKKENSVLLALIATAAILLASSGTFAQHMHGQGEQKKTATTGTDPEMARMMQSPQHHLMMAYMRSMRDFASILHDQAVKPAPLDVEFARTTVAELRHGLDAAEALHQKHVQMMSTEMQTKMKTMMEQMDKNRSMLKEQVTALEADVQADKPDSKQVALHAGALLKHLEMMSKTKPGRKM